MPSEPLSEQQRKLVQENLGLAYAFAGRVRSISCDYDERLSAGFLGLIRASRTFDPSLGKFQNHAWRWMRNCLQQDVKSVRECVHIPFRHGEKLTREKIDLAQIGVSVDLPITEDDATARFRRCLPMRNRVILRLYYWENLSDRSIAELLNVSHQAVHNMRRYSIEKMKKLYRPTAKSH